MRERWVYILRRLDPDTLVHIHKIGISYNPGKRARQCDAVLIHLERGGRQREQELHRKFADFHHPRGDLKGSTEWFLDEENEIHDYIQAARGVYEDGLD